MPNARRSLLPLLAVLSLASGCIVAAAAGVGYVVSQKVLPGEVHTAQVKDDVERVFRVATETLGILVDPGTEVTTQSAPRSARCQVDGADVTVTVEAYDLERTDLRVEAERTLRKDGATARMVLDEILRRLRG